MKAEVAHLDKKGQVVLGKRASRSQKRGMAQTYVVSWKDAETQAITTLPITQYGLGRKVCFRSTILQSFASGTQTIIIPTPMYLEAYSWRTCKLAVSCTKLHWI